MLLRASGQQEDKEYELSSVTSEHQRSGVVNEDHLRALTEASILGDWLALPTIRERAEKAMGIQNTVDALVVASAFNGITRVADATGIQYGYIVKPVDGQESERTCSLQLTARSRCLKKLQLGL